MLPAQNCSSRLSPAEFGAQPSFAHSSRVFSQMSVSALAPILLTAATRSIASGLMIGSSLCGAAIAFRTLDGQSLSGCSYLFSCRAGHTHCLLQGSAAASPPRPGAARAGHEAVLMSPRFARSTMRSEARKARAWIVQVGWPRPEVTKLLPSHKNRFGTS
jgi:hypothetical protein